jgi:hypothetical protein
MVIIENGKVKILNLIRRLEFFRFCFYKSKNTSPFVPFPSYLGTKGDKREQRQSSLTIIPFPMVTMVTRGIVKFLEFSF